MIEFIKSPSNVWRKFPQSKPKSNDFYLLELSPDFRDYPTYIVAKFEKGKWWHSELDDVLIPENCNVRYRPIEGRVAMSLGDAFDLADAITEISRGQDKRISKTSDQILEKFFSFMMKHKIVQCYANAYDEDGVIK